MFPPGNRTPPVIDFEPIDFEPIEEPTQVPQERSLLGRGWDMISQPLTDAPSRFMSSIADYIDPAVQGPEDYSPVRSFGAGALQGIGNLVSGLTSPINLGTAALTGGSSLALKSGLPAIGRGLAYGARGAGALTAGHGAGEVLDPESTLGERGFGLAEIAGGVAGMRTPTALKAGPIVPEVIPPEITPKPIFAEAEVQNARINPQTGKVIIPGKTGALTTPVIQQGGPEGLDPGFVEQFGDVDLAATHRKQVPRNTPTNVLSETPTLIDESELFPSSEVLTPQSVTPEIPPMTTGQAPTPVLPKYEPIVIVRQANATVDTVKQARAKGYEFIGVNEKGDFRFKKMTTPVVETPPILETEVGQQRPTKAKAKEQQQQQQQQSQQPIGEEGHLGPLADVKRSPIVEAFNFGRATMASVDMSAPLRQGLPLIHKKSFWTALKPMFQSWKSEDAFRASQSEIASRPLFRPRIGKGGKEMPSFAQDAGLKLTDLTNLTTREEALMSTWAEKVPWVRRSNRAYTTFLNRLRADTFENLVKDGAVFGADAKANIPLARSLAEFVNVTTGRGSLGKLEPAAVALNTGLFAPRLIASRLKMLNPAFYIMGPPQVRKEAIKSLFAIATVGNTITQLGRMAGGEVSADPSSSDFGKLKIGNTRVDPYGGFQQYIVAANRLLNPLGPVTGFEGETPLTRGQMITSSTSGKEYDLWNPQGPFDPTSAVAAGRFLRGKMHPVLGFAWSLFSGQKEMSGEKMNFSTMNPFENSIAQRFIPIFLQDVYELAQSDELPAPVKALVMGASAFGMGSQTYGEPTRIREREF